MFTRFEVIRTMNSPAFVSYFSSYDIAIRLVSYRRARNAGVDCSNNDDEIGLWPINNINTAR